MVFTVTVSTNGNHPFDGYVTLSIGDYKDILVPVNSKAVFTLNTVDFGEGSYVVYAKYSNDTHCAPSQISDSFIIRPKATIIAKDRVRAYNTAYDYKAAFYDFEGNALANTYVEFVVGKIQYKVKTDSKGVAKLKAKLSAGTHTILIKNLVTKESLTKKVKIVKRITAKNAKVFYNSGSYYKVRIYKTNGKHVGANKKVTFKFNGKKYTVKTSKNGYAKFKVATKDVTPKTYKVYITYLKYKATKKIKVKHVIKARKTTKVSKNGTSVKVKITLKGKKVLKNKKVSVTFYGKTKVLKTNKKGVAYYKLTKNTINKLTRGYKYALTLKYEKEILKRYVKVRSKSYSNFNVYFIM